MVQPTTAAGTYCGQSTGRAPEIGLWVGSGDVLWPEHREGARDRAVGGIAVLGQVAPEAAEDRGHGPAPRIVPGVVVEEVPAVVGSVG